MRGWVLGLAVASLALGAGCSSAPKQSHTAVTASPTPIERLNTGSMRLAQTPFCSRLSDAALRDALASKKLSGVKATRWGNGDKADVETGLDDVVHEIGCRWSHDQSSASAWVFARSTTAQQAQAVVADSGRHRGCRAATTGVSFGSPSVRQACRLSDGTRRVRVAGLFGATWLSCEVAAPGATPARDVRERADAWCVQVANALNTTR
ncbi:hypothetical protein [Nocardioides mangrovicus]|uniref:hypothetical protein n=1 Tax=Nocardioides mangrovicus TaxID=2478913 RepID=UPI0011C3C03F|nr:hypothetical protein [Nocardioides mangrovicus]